MSDDGSVEEWLAENWSELTHELTKILNVEAGLSDVMIEAHGNSMSRDLDETLRVEAGLAEILLAEADSNQSIYRFTPSSSERVEARRLLSALPPVQRLALRGHPAVSASIYAALIKEAVALAEFLLVENTADRVVPRAAARSMALGLFRDVELADIRDISRAFNLAHARFVAFALANSLDQHSAHVEALELAHDLAADLALDISRAPNFSPAQDLIRAMTYYLGLSRKSAQANGPDRKSTHERDVKLVRDISRALARNLARKLAKSSLSGLTEAHESFGLVILEGVLDDFTQSDLSEVDLVGINLVGVFWTFAGTCWPASLDIEQLFANSLETTPGSGVYVVMPGMSPLRGRALV